MYGGFPKPAIQTRHRTPNSQKERLGVGEAFPSQKNQAQEEEKPAREEDWREVDAGLKTNFLETLDTASNR
jgi:hypothetical protein